jgi:hypothetical protein
MNKRETRVLTERILKLPMLFRAAIWRSERMPKTDLSHMQMMVLGEAYRAKILNMTELGGAVSVSSQQITRLVDDWCEKGFYSVKVTPKTGVWCSFGLQRKAIPLWKATLMLLLQCFTTRLLPYTPSDTRTLQKAWEIFAIFLRALQNLQHETVKKTRCALFFMAATWYNSIRKIPREEEERYHEIFSHRNGRHGRCAGRIFGCGRQ